MQEEKWEVVPYYDKYEISNHGRVRSIATGTAHVLKCTETEYGYIRFTISSSGKVKSVLVHRLVANSFVENKENLPIVMHIDNNKKNNYFANLKWGTRKQNAQDAFRDGLITHKGVQRRKSNLTEKDVMDIFKSKETCRALAKVYSVNHTCIVDIRSGRSWNHITGLLYTRKIKPKFSKDIKFVDD